MLALDQGRLRNAQQLLRLNLEGSNLLDSESASTHAWIYCMRGMPERTMAAFARHLNPADSARRMQVLGEIAELARLRGELSSAQDYLRQVLDHLPRTRLIELAPVCCLRLGLTCLEMGDARGGHAYLQEALERDERIGGQAQVGAPVRAMLQWDVGGPLAEPPEPGQACPYSQRARYFLIMGEFARGNLRREDALRAYRRAILESPTSYRYAAWLAAMRLGELGVELSPNIPLWPTLISGRANTSEL
jgi:tetratricopeptide (TPR) repeat protein